MKYFILLLSLYIPVSIIFSCNLVFACAYNIPILLQNTGLTLAINIGIIIGIIIENIKKQNVKLHLF